ncbi:hypothetical protein [Castellaniella denitrificans]|uniref:CdiI immunity protein domain-containing protein n=1 Tax=Castellaniella denitrificans TaxID=56119 RepID=A0ABT4M9A4_9BURK|nr:hypothetical protein [Castellaniella denitrificans]MCZ4331050.1 hypothetical protein [Castellaniella denitrificans]
MLMTQEHYDLMAAFERFHSGRFDREDKSLWPKGVIYQDGLVNEMFLAFRHGYAYSQADTRADIQNVEASRDVYRNDARTLHAALERMVAMYESEFDHENTHKWRPDWLVDALACRNALSGEGI